MKYRFRKITKSVVDFLLRLAGLPTYTEMRSECRGLILSENSYFGHDQCERFQNIQNILRRSL